MELSQEKKTQIAACHGKGMTVKEIAKTAKLTEAQVDVFLQSIGKKPLYRRYAQTKKKSEDTKRSYNRLTEEQKNEVCKLAKEGCTQYVIAQKLGIGASSVSRILSATKEKEPATAGTVTDSQKTDVIVEDNTVSISKDNTGSQKSQALLKSIQKEFLGIYERLDESHQHAWDLGELHAQIKEAIGNADT